MFGRSGAPNTSTNMRTKYTGPQHWRDLLENRFGQLVQQDPCSRERLKVSNKAKGCISQRGRKLAVRQTATSSAPLIGRLKNCSPSEISARIISIVQCVVMFMSRQIRRREGENRAAPGGSRRHAKSDDARLRILCSAAFCDFRPDSRQRVRAPFNRETTIRQTSQANETI